ncbi:MAG: ABC transporter permease [Sporolactobacillus sp.]|jgi:putative spermidine/putrescine transport system permease protein|nr:ABC transporter permease [Sporolactobacillus sp.]
MNNEKNSGLTVFTWLTFIFLLGPLVIIFLTSFGADSYLSFPPKSLSLRWYRHIFATEAFITTFKTSVFVSCIGNLIALIIGLPTAYILSRYQFIGKKAVNMIFLSPLLIPGIVLGFTLLKYVVVAYHFPIYTSLLIGHSVIMLPFIIRVVSASLANFDFTIEEAALSLGAGKIAALFKVVLPNIRSGLIAAILLAFLESFNNVDVSIFLVGPGVSTLPIQMLQYVENYFDPTIAAISVLLMVLTAILMFFIDRLTGLSYFTKRGD